MISENDKQAILNGAYGISRGGFRCKFVGISISKSIFTHYFVYFDDDGLICHNSSLTKDFKNCEGADSVNDVIGIWQNKAEPFNLEKALAGEPVMLRNGSKAYVKYIMPTEYKGDYPLVGYMLCDDALYTCNWSQAGEALVRSDKQPHDIIEMWKEPEPVSDTVTVTLPRALRKPRDEMWFVDADRVTRSSNDKNISAGDLARIPYFGSEADAKAWFDAMLNSRK